MKNILEKMLGQGLSAWRGIWHCCLLLPLAAPAQAGIDALSPSAGIEPWLLQERPHRFAEVHLDSDHASVGAMIQVAPGDVGQARDLYAVALVNGQWYAKAAAGWRPWDQRLSSLEPAERRVLGADEVLEIVAAERLPAGDYEVFAGYADAAGVLHYNQQPLAFQVESQTGPGLRRFASAAAMEAYLKEGLQQGGRVPVFNTTELAVADLASGAPRVSGTNIQVAGVDEADTVKTDADLLYALRHCDEQACLEVMRLNPDAPASTTLASYRLDGQAPEGLYLVKHGQGDMLVTLAGRHAFGHWFDPWGWDSGSTEVMFYDVSNPTAMGLRQSLTLDGHLVASRRVDDALYLVTRFTPRPPGFDPHPTTPRERETNAELLSDTSLPTLLPSVRDASNAARELVQGMDCYLPIETVDQAWNASIITITALSLSAPGEFSSVCFVGDSEAMYVSGDNLYLATTRHDYQVVPDVIRGDLPFYEPDHSTSIHKFALTPTGPSYRGSGEVKGHLGWQQDKKSFRMGENGHVLNVVTSVGSSWNGTASTRLAVLREQGGRLTEVHAIEGIGKPNEELFAARFLGKRAYLVTFEVTDPLYVLDLSNPERPSILGELEVEGYADYLHPVGENLLLGIGKDALPMPANTIGGMRGALPQGVKLTLFDVSNPAAPREIQSRVLGRRGSETPLTWDHHALAFLPASGGRPARVALPIQVNDRHPDYPGFDPNDPWAWFGRTHTALYTFELSELGISQAGRIMGSVHNDSFDFWPRPLPMPMPVDDGSIAPGDAPGTKGDGVAASEPGVVSSAERQPVPDEPIIGIMPILPILPYVPSYEDRAVLLEDAVFYWHQGKMLRALWGSSL